MKSLFDAIEEINEKQKEFDEKQKEFDEKQKEDELYIAEIAVEVLYISDLLELGVTA
jgi:flagellar hook-basal body complex protein FliE